MVIDYYKQNNIEFQSNPKGILENFNRRIYKSKEFEII